MAEASTAAPAPEVSIEALAANQFDCEPSWQLPSRTRPRYQLWLITGGGVTSTVDDGPPLRLVPRSALLVAPGVRHRAWHDPNNPLQCHVMHFVARVYGVPAVLLWPTQAISDIPEQPFAEYLQCAVEMAREIHQPQAGARLLANAAITRLLGLLQRNNSRSQVQLLHSDNRVSELVAATLKHIRTCYAQDLSLGQLASAAHVSSAHLGHVFRDAVGLSPLQYLQHHRIDLAKSLLVETDLAIHQIAARVGFRDRYYFSRVFRRLEGSSPLYYRQAQRSGELH